MNQVVTFYRDWTFRLSLLLGILFPFALHAQEVTFTLLRSSADEAIIRADFPTCQTLSVEVNDISMNRLQMKNAFPVLQTGAPELLESATSIIIPDNCTPTVDILSTDYQILNNFELAPSKGRLLRNTDPASIAYQKGAVYSENRLLYNDSIQLGTPYQFRDYRGMAMHFYPFAYNPVQKTLKVYSSITVRVRFNGSLSTTRAQKLNSAFDAIYTTHFLNYTQVRSTPLTENGNILILAPDNFCSAMQPYADWKIKTGYPTEIIPLSTAGSTSSAIKNYISNYYNQHNLAFVLIVGDNGQFPTISIGGNVSDNYYAEIAGNDNYPDVILGKISAETVGQVSTQVERFIEYEKNPTSTAHFPVYCGVASTEGPGDNNEYDYQHIRNIGNMLAAYTYTSGFEVFDGSQGGLDASGDATASLVSSAVNSGVGIIDYCGHGADTYWVSSNFSVSNVNSLTNEGKLPVILSVACVNGNYSGQTCFAEAWLRATHNNQPSGAAGVLMSTINQPWESPMCAQDEMIKYLTGNGTYTKMNTFGGIAFNGFLKMLDNYNDYEVSRTWILFGDPAMMVRTAVPQTLTLNYGNTYPLGTNNVSISSSVEGAKVVLSCGSQILSSGLISGGTVNLALPDTLTVGDSICVVGTALNYLPSMGYITLFPNQGPYLICNSVALHDNGNDDGLADYGETVTIDPTFTNVGSENATNVVIKYRTQDPYITLIDSVLQISLLNSELTGTYPAAFSIRIADNVPAAHHAQITMHITYNGTSAHDNHTSLILHAPALAIQNLQVNDATLGNDNMRLDSNETADLVITLQNNGNGSAANGIVTITSPDDKLFFVRHANVVASLTEGETITTVFRVQVQNIASLPTTTTVHMTYQADNYTVSKEVTLKIGVVEEDWEAGNFNRYAWNNNSNVPWTITAQGTYAGQYSARSGNISNNASSILTITRSNSAPDTLSFYYFVSSEEEYDYLKFYIDGSLKGSWSGEIAWRQAAYYVPAGQHTYKWEYTKDSYGTGGSDLAMIDNIFFPCLSAGTVSVDDFSEPEISLLPNPASDYVRIMIKDEASLTSNTYCQIYDISGKLLRTEAISSATSSISMADLAQGLYIFKIRNNNAVLKTFKVVKY